MHGSSIHTPQDASTLLINGSMCYSTHLKIVRAVCYLAVDEGGDGEVPGGVGGHDEAEEGPDPVVVEGGDEHGGGAAGAEDVGPRPLVQLVVDVVDVAAASRQRVIAC